jgi:hypothetical protein
VRSSKCMPRCPLHLPDLPDLLVGLLVPLPAVETPWADDLGPSGVDGARRVRLANVPFLHAKPTYGDVIVVTPNPHGFLTRDRDGVAWEKILTRIDEDSGRWVMIVEYTLTMNSDAQAVFSALDEPARRSTFASRDCGARCEARTRSSRRR